MSNQTFSVTEYAKLINKTRQCVLYRIKQGKLPKNVTCNKVGETYVLNIKTDLEIKIPKETFAQKAHRIFTMFIHESAANTTLNPEYVDFIKKELEICVHSMSKSELEDFNKKYSPAMISLLTQTK